MKGSPLRWRPWILETTGWFVTVGTCALAATLDLRGGGDSQLMSERSLVEGLQVFLLGLAATLLAVGSRRDCLWLNGWLALIVAMIVRESDFLLDRYVADGAWQAVVALLAAAFLAWTIRRRPGFRSGRLVIAATSGYFVCALAVLAAAQGLGYKGVWAEILGSDFNRSAKNFAEEATELLGVTLLFMGSVRYRILRGELASAD